MSKLSFSHVNYFIFIIYKMSNNTQQVPQQVPQQVQQQQQQQQVQQQQQQQVPQPSQDFSPSQFNNQPNTECMRPQFGTQQPLNPEFNGSQPRYYEQMQSNGNSNHKNAMLSQMKEPFSIFVLAFLVFTPAIYQRVGQIVPKMLNQTQNLTMFGVAFQALVVALCYFFVKKMI